MKTYIQNLFIMLALLAGIHQAAAQGTTAFTYQGQLRDGGTNANGSYTIVFTLYDAVTSGGQIGSTVTTSPTLANGLFSVNLDFGAGAFNGSARWLDITVTIGATTQTLSPRVQVLPAPYAQFAAVAATVTNGGIMNAQLAGNAVASTNISSGQVVKSLNGLRDVVNLLPGTNLVFTTNGNVLQISTGSSAVTAIDGNLRIVRGLISGDGTISYGSGFSLSYTPAGSGGTIIGGGNTAYIIGQGDHQFDASFLGPDFPKGQFIMAQNGHTLYQVSDVVYTGTNGFGVPQYTVSIEPGFQDNSPATFLKDMSLSPIYTIIFTTPYSDPPIIVASVGGGTDYLGNTTNPDILKVARSDAVSARSTFSVVLTQASVGGDINNGNGFDFIAIGPQ